MAGNNLLHPPAPAQMARFAKNFGQRALLTVDAGDESDPARLARFQTFCEGVGVVPVYLLDMSVSNSRPTIDLLEPAIREGRAEVGIKQNPFPQGNDPEAFERDRLIATQDAIERNFGVSPMIYRTDPQGLCPHTTGLLMECGIAIDSSVRARFDCRPDHGPDFRHHPASPYWSNAERQLLELPLTTVFWGMLRKQGAWLFPVIENRPGSRELLSRLGLLERISLTPENATTEQAVRAIDMAVDDGLPVLVIGLQSHNIARDHPNEDDIDAHYDWLRGVYGYLEHMGVRPTTVREIMQSVIV